MCLRNWKGSVNQRFHWWRNAIEKQISTLPARDRYAGDAWSQVLCAAEHPKIPPSLWVVSAGVGFIPSDHGIPNYSATFANNELDSVASHREEKIEWWNRLVSWRRESNSIGCVTDLALQNPNSVFLIALSSNYLDVIKNDILYARKALSSTNNLLVISSGTKKSQFLGDSLLPIDAKFENLVGGARSTLNSRMLRYIVQQNEGEQISASKVSESLRALSGGIENIRKFDRLQLTDGQIYEFVKNESNQNNAHSASALLRRLRDKGMACEQKRFRRIYKIIHPTT